ncbi:MAG: hypothetical protein IJV72_04970 [Clostridia bacterium]|nr:hypothetical protein [Clostridia bacterium]
MEENKKQNETFNYTYSAKQQDEIKKIRERYLPENEDKMEQLRRLDASVTKKGTVVSLIIGIISSLVMGTGMCCAMLWEEYAIGIAVGVVGIIGVCLAYPIYSSITKKEKERIAPEIIRLTDELMK